MTKKQLQKLIETAKKARQKAYCPYSRFPIGAAVLTASGKIFSGANVENASYGLTICGERVAIFNAVAHGDKELRAICVAGVSARPCGACRQVMLEFSTKETDLFVVDVGTDSRRECVTRTKMFKMLPHAFDPLDAGLLPRSPQNLLKRNKTAKAPARRRSRARKQSPRKKRQP